MADVIENSGKQNVVPARGTRGLAVGAPTVFLALFLAVAVPATQSWAQGSAPNSARISALIQKANNGDGRAAYNLGLAYHLGQDVKQDDTEAAKWLMQAASRGDLQATNILGTFYHEGIGVEKDDRAALKYYQLAADKKYAKAEYNLGNFYHEGTAVRKDETESIRWYKMAAEQGEIAAQVSLGFIYLQGSDAIKTDYEESYFWFVIAAHNGDADAAQSRDRIAKTLSPQQMADVKTRLGAWAQAHADTPPAPKK